MTLADLLQDSLGLLGVLREGETPSAEQGAQGLTLFNNLVASWRESGIDLPIEPQSLTTSALTINEGDKLTLTNLLAVHLQPYYPGRALSPVVVSVATSGYDRWLRNAVTSDIQPRKMNTISKGTGIIRSQNILTGV